MEDWKRWARAGGVTWLVTAAVLASDAGAALPILARLASIAVFALVGAGLVVRPNRQTMQWGAVVGLAAFAVAIVAGLSGTPVEFVLLVALWFAFIITSQAVKKARAAGIMFEPPPEPKGPPPELI
jgi:hypothetical protein